MQRRTSIYIRIHTYTIAYIGIQVKHMITYDRRDIARKSGYRETPRSTFFDSIDDIKRDSKKICFNSHFDPLFSVARDRIDPFSVYNRSLLCGKQVERRSSN